MVNQTNSSGKNQFKLWKTPKGLYRFEIINPTTKRIWTEVDNLPKFINREYNFVVSWTENSMSVNLNKQLISEYTRHS